MAMPRSNSVLTMGTPRMAGTPICAATARRKMKCRNFIIFQTTSIVLQIMGLRHGAQAGGGALGRDVPLRHAQHLKADHEFPDGRGAQQRRIVVRVEVPLRKFMVGFEM